MSRLHFLIALALALANGVPESTAESKTNDDVKLLAGLQTSEKGIGSDDKKKASDEIGRLGSLSPSTDPHQTQLKAAVKGDSTDLKKEDSVIKLKYEPKKDIMTASGGQLEEEEGLWKTLKSFLKQNLEAASAKNNQQLDDQMKKFWDTFYYKDDSDKTDLGQSKLKTQVEAESRVLETKDVKRKIKEKEQGVGTETLFDLGEKLFDQSFDSESDNVKILNPSAAAATKKQVVSKVVYADEVTGDQMLDEKDDKVLGAQEEKWGEDELHKVIKEQKASDRKKKQKAEDPFKKTSFGTEVDEEKIHEERTVTNTGGGFDPRSIFRGYLPSFGQNDDDDDDYDDDSSENEDDDYNDDEDDDDREDSSVWLRRAITSNGIGGRIPLFLDSNLNLYVPIRIPSTGTSSNGPSFPGFQNSDNNGNQGGRNGGGSGGQRFSRITELVGKRKKDEKVKINKALEVPFIKAHEAEHKFGMILYPWVPLKDLVEKVEDVMKELNIKANRVEAKTGAPLFEFGFEIIEVKEKKFLLETRTVKDPEGKRRVHVTLLAVKPITAEEAKKVEELKEEKKIIDELLDRKKELHELWVKRKESKAEELSKKKEELIKAIFGATENSENE